ncbi:MAG: hypothetical protein ACI91V_000281, partial [Lentimonas sp.]
MLRLRVVVSAEASWTLLRLENVRWRKLKTIKFSFAPVIRPTSIRKRWFNQDAYSQICYIFSCLHKNLNYVTVMVQFVPQKSRLSPRILPKTFWVIMAFVMLQFPLLGQEKIDYRGAWQTETPDNGKLILLVKRNNLASYFWADNSDRTVYQGSWSSDIDGATLKWEDGSTHRLALELLGYKITHSDTSANVLYNTSATRLPEEILGQWAKAPSKPEEQLSDRDKAKGFFGTWQIGAETNPYYLVIEPDRSAATDWIHRDSSNSGLRGSWAKQGSELHIAWDTGHYGILKQNDRSFTFQRIAPGSVIEKDTSDELTATRVSKDLLPDDWQALYDDEKTTHPGGVPFTNRKDAISFYRGSWIVQRSEDIFERIEIGRFGGLKTSTDDTLYGSWRMSGQDISMNWEDGMRKILRPVGNGFIIYDYKPGRPIDGVPTRIFSATPENANQLAKHMEGHKKVAMKLLSRATDAGVTSSVKDAGWGQPFLRWAWPFGDDSEDTPFSGALLKADVETSKRIDPWWWPFWSETPPLETAPETNTERSTVEIVTNSETVRETETAKPSPPDWNWP